LSPMSIILGKRISGLLLKRRKAETKHPMNRMFLMFDDGSGFEFFGGLILPWDIHRDCDYKHDVRHRLKKDGYSTVYFAGEPEGNDKKTSLDALSEQRRETFGDDGYDKGIALLIAGRRIQ